MEIILNENISFGSGRLAIETLKETSVVTAPILAIAILAIVTYLIIKSKRRIWTK